MAEEGRSDLRAVITFDSWRQASDVIGRLTSEGIRVEWLGPEAPEQFAAVIQELPNKPVR